MVEGFILTPEDRDILRALLKWWKRQPQVQGRGWTIPPEASQAPVTYVAYVPTHGIPALSAGIWSTGTGTGSRLQDDVPGSALCDIYQVVREDLGGEFLITLEPIARQETVLNLGSSPATGDTWMPVSREAFGAWIGLASVGTPATVTVMESDYDPAVHTSVIEVDVHAGFTVTPTLLPDGLFARALVSMVPADTYPSSSVHYAGNVGTDWQHWSGVKQFADSIVMERLALVRFIVDMGVPIIDGVSNLSLDFGLNIHSLLGEYYFNWSVHDTTLAGTASDTDIMHLTNYGQLTVLDANSTSQAGMNAGSFGYPGTHLPYFFVSYAGVNYTGAWSTISGLQFSGGIYTGGNLTLFGSGPPGAGIGAPGNIYLDLSDPSNPQLYYFS